MPIYAIDNLVPQIHTDTYISPESTVIGNVIVKAGASIWPQAVLRGDCDTITLEESSNVQDGAVLHADHGFPITVGKRVTVGHQAMLHGCTIGENTLVGMQAVVLNGAIIGENCLVGAGALVTEGKSFPNNSLILGAPARVVRELTCEEIKELGNNSEHYIQKGNQFKRGLRRIS